MTLNYWKQPLWGGARRGVDDARVEALILADTGLRPSQTPSARLGTLRMLDLGHNAIAELPDASGISPA